MACKSLLLDKDGQWNFSYPLIEAPNFSIPYEQSDDISTSSNERRRPLDVLYPTFKHIVTFSSPDRVLVTLYSNQEKYQFVCKRIDLSLSLRRCTIEGIEFPENLEIDKKVQIKSISSYIFIVKNHKVESTSEELLMTCKFFEEKIIEIALSYKSAEDDCAIFEPYEDIVYEKTRALIESNQKQIRPDEDGYTYTLKGNSIIFQKNGYYGYTHMEHWYTGEVTTYYERIETYTKVFDNMLIAKFVYEFLQKTGIEKIARIPFLFDKASRIVTKTNRVIEVPE